MNPSRLRLDPYRHCRDACNHDLAVGVLVTDLLGEDGPYPVDHPMTSIGLYRAPVLQPPREAPAAA